MIEFNDIRDYENPKRQYEEEVLVLIFIIMDQNADGLITPGDLINFIGATNEKVLTNPLIMEDVYEIMRYLNVKNSREESLADRPSFEYEELTD